MLLNAIETLSHCESISPPDLLVGPAVRSMIMPSLPLSELAKNDPTKNDPALSSRTLVVADVGGPPELANRLQALGFCEGRKMTIVRRGDPAIVEVLGTRIGMSSAISQYVTVRID